MVCSGVLQGPIAGQAMRRSVQGMLEELSYNLWEHILCRLVDYGHTFSPEVCSWQCYLRSVNMIWHARQCVLGRKCISALTRPSLRSVVSVVTPVQRLPFTDRDGGTVIRQRAAAW